MLFLPFQPVVRPVQHIMIGKNHQGPAAGGSAGGN